MTCGICRNPNTPGICTTCKTRTSQDLTWLATNLNDLENYRINRAYAHHDNTGGGGTRSEAPTPVRDALFDALYGDRDGNLIETLNAWAMCLGQPPAPKGQLAKQANLINTDPNLWAPGKTGASTVYAAETNRITSRLRNIVANMDETRIMLGTCLNPDCNKPVYGPPEAKNARCEHCGNTWTATLLRRATDRQLTASNATGTAGELSLMLDTFGIEVPASTIRSWASRGQLQPVTDRHGQPTKRYRLADAYQLTKK